MARGMTTLRARLLSALLLAAGALMIVRALVLAVNNVQADRESGAGQVTIEQALTEQIAQGTHAAPEGDMPIAEVDGISYIGLLEIPTLGLSLPVQSTWNDQSARVSPARWSGSAYDDNLVIAGQAYQSQFGNIGQLQAGDSLALTDIYGNRLEYDVVEQYTIDGDAVIDTSGADSDLLLCTYTADGLYGTCVSCESTL